MKLNGCVYNCYTWKIYFERNTSVGVIELWQILTFELINYELLYTTVKLN